MTLTIEVSLVNFERGPYSERALCVQGIVAIQNVGVDDDIVQEFSACARVRFHAVLSVDSRCKKEQFVGGCDFVAAVFGGKGLLPFGVKRLVAGAACRNFFDGCSRVLDGL